MDPLFIGKEKIATLLPMAECIDVMKDMFRSMARGEITQPLRSLMWLPDRKGLLGMMPGFATSLGVMGIKVITVFHANKDAGYPSHQGVIILFDTKHGEPLMMFDAFEITAIRTAAASAVATELLSKKNSQVLAIIGSGEQAERHIEAIQLVRNINQIRIWSRNQEHAKELTRKVSGKYNISIDVSETPKAAVSNADIICTVTSSQQPVIDSEWINHGAHINAVGTATPKARELDTATIMRSKLFTDCYESIFNEPGEFLIPKSEGLIANGHVKAELGELLEGRKKGREDDQEVTVFKSLGLAAEDIFSAWHIYKKLTS